MNNLHNRAIFFLHKASKSSKSLFNNEIFKKLSKNQPCENQAIFRGSIFYNAKVILKQICIVANAPLISHGGRKLNRSPLQ